MKIWPYLVGTWLVMHGLMSLVNLSFRYDDVVMGALALLAGVFVFIRQ